MLRLVVPAIALLFAAPAVAETRSYDVKDFKKIRVNSVYEVEFVQGPKFSVEIDSQYGDFSFIIVKKDGDTLRITRPAGMHSQPLHDVVRISAPDLEELGLHSAVDFKAKNLNLDVLALDLHSAVTLDIQGMKVDDLM